MGCESSHKEHYRGARIYVLEESTHGHVDVLGACEIHRHATNVPHMGQAFLPAIAPPHSAGNSSDAYSAAGRVELTRARALR